MRKDIITPVEADVFLAQYLSWTALTNDQKLYYIGRASVYVQLAWTCADVDWADDTTITDNMREAIAYYAFADSAGNLYGDVAVADEFKGSIKHEKYKLDTLALENAWYARNAAKPSGSHSSLGYPNSLMEVACTFNSSVTELVRV